MQCFFRVVILSVAKDPRTFRVAATRPLCTAPATIIPMTQLDVLYRYGIPPSESSVLALARVREVYGIRSLELNERDKTVRLEYDATRLTEAVIHQLLRRSGLDIIERVALTTTPPPPPPPAEAKPAA